VVDPPQDDAADLGACDLAEKVNLG
jgi:hypothetical protein